MSLASVGRKRKIIDQLNEDGKVIVKELAEELDVTTETIRKYLDDLQEEGKLIKVYGGAIPPKQKEIERPSYDREVINKEEKEKIAKEAVNLVDDHDVIAIDEGSTPFYLAKHLEGKHHLTIVTPSINSLNTLMQAITKGLFTGKIIFIGGEVDVEHQRVSGELALSMLNNIFVDKFFLSADGISKSGIITSHDVAKGNITKGIMQHANENILLLDRSKLGNRGHYSFSQVEDIDRLITDGELSKDWKRLFVTHNVEVTSV